MSPHVMLYSDRPGIYGAEQINHEIALGLIQSGHRCTFVQPVASHHLISARQDAGVDHRWLQPDDIYDLSTVARTLTDTAQPERILRETRPDVVLFSDSCPFSNLAAKRVAASLDIPFATTVHCINPQWLIDYAPWVSDVGSQLAAAEEVIAVSESNLCALRTDYGLAEHRGRVIHNGRPARFFAEPSTGTRNRMRSELNLPTEAIVCLTVARFEHSKGYQHQLEAVVQMQRHPAWRDLRFVWVGEGTWRARVERTARLVGGGKISVLESRDDVSDLLDAADIFVLPSLFEGMPLSVMEAMGKGLAVIATDVGGTSEALGTTGVVLDDPSRSEVAADLARHVSHLAQDQDLRQQMGRSASQRARRMFTLERMQLEYHQVIDRMLQ